MLVIKKNVVDQEKPDQQPAECIVSFLHRAFRNFIDRRNAVFKWIWTICWNWNGNVWHL